MNIAKDSSGLLSVVVIGLNEEQRIRQCLQGVRKSVEEIPGTEIVYVDSGSNDRTVSIALSEQVKVFQTGRSQISTPASGRYVGSVVTSGRFIMFVDGDTRVLTGWIRPALELMDKNPKIVMFSGTFSPGCEQYNGPERIDPATVKPVYRTSGHNAPIIRRDALEAAGNWNPFVRCREEEDLAIRLRHYVSGGLVCCSQHCTVDTPKAPINSKGELLRRWKRGFIKGPGQILKNAIAAGYWRQCWRVSKPMVLVTVLIVGLAASVALGLWRQFIAVFLAICLARGILIGGLRGIITVFYSFLLGFYSLWEFLTSPVRTASNYIPDYKQIISDNETGVQEQQKESRV